MSSGTFELGYSRYFGPSLLARVRSRYYQQTAAAFFRDAYFYETLGQSADTFTGDRELAPLRHVTVGGKLSYLATQRARAVWGVFDEVRLNLKGDLLFMQELPTTGDGPNPAGIDHQFLGTGQLVDGFVLQIGLQLAY